MREDGGGITETHAAGRCRGARLSPGGRSATGAELGKRGKWREEGKLIKTESKA